MIDSRTLNAMRRLKTEYDGLFQNLNLTNNLGVGFALINSDDIFNWRLDYIGPRDTPYSDGLFMVLMHFPNDYPNHPPEVTFKTPIYHLNVNPRRNDADPLGKVCLSILNRWQPTYKIEDILVSIFALFYMVNPESPYGLERVNEYKNNRSLYEEKIKYNTRRYAASNGIREFLYEWDFSLGP